jgi:hypothetical protein
MGTVKIVWAVRLVNNLNVARMAPLGILLRKDDFDIFESYVFKDSFVSIKFILLGRSLQRTWFLLRVISYTECRLPSRWYHRPFIQFRSTPRQTNINMLSYRVAAPEVPLTISTSSFIISIPNKTKLYFVKRID